MKLSKNQAKRLASAEEKIKQLQLIWNDFRHAELAGDRKRVAKRAVLVEKEEEAEEEDEEEEEEEEQEEEEEEEEEEEYQGEEQEEEEEEKEEEEEEYQEEEEEEERKDGGPYKQYKSDVIDLENIYAESRNFWEFHYYPAETAFVRGPSDERFARMMQLLEEWIPKHIEACKLHMRAFAAQRVIKKTEPPVEKKRPPVTRRLFRDRRNGKRKRLIL